MYRRRHQIYDLPESEANKLIASGVAVLVDLVETAAIVPSEFSGGSKGKQRKHKN